VRVHILRVEVDHRGEAVFSHLVHGRRQTTAVVTFAESSRPPRSRLLRRRFGELAARAAAAAAAAAAGLEGRSAWRRATSCTMFNSSARSRELNRNQIVDRRPATTMSERHS